MKTWMIVLLALVACSESPEPLDCSACAPEAVCADAPLGVVCECKSGYTGDGKTCRDVDECTLHTSTCDPIATCENQPGGFGCTCPEGFTGDGLVCADVDECADGSAVCPTGLTCENLPGRSTCLCPPGQQIRGDTCYAGVDRLTVNKYWENPTQSACAIQPYGLTCWGYFHPVGLLPEGDTPVEWETIHMGSKHVCGLDRSGDAWCAGDDDTGALGRGEQAFDVFYNAPGRVTGQHHFAQIRAGGRSSCGIDMDRHLWCWGQPYETLVRSFAPVQIDDELWLEVGIGLDFACGLRVDGTIWCWGDRAYGTPSFGEEGALPVVPEPISTLTFRTLSVGERSACAIGAQDGLLYCWGGNTGGEIGAAPPGTPRFYPGIVDIDRWVTVEVGQVHTCGVREDGSLACFGDNDYGQLGLGDYDPRLLAEQVGEDHDWVDVTAGAQLTCARRENDSVWCFGDNQLGEVGLVTPQAYFQPQYLTLEGNSWTQLSSGATGTCAIDNMLNCWGTNGRFTADDQRSPTPRAVFQQPELNAFGAGLVTSDGETCAAGADGGLWCFGVESFPDIQTGAGVVSLVGGSYRFGSRQTCWLGNDHGLHCEGEGAAPVVPAGSWKSLSLAPDHGCGLDEGNRLFCWGKNQAGQLGDGSFVDSDSPVPTGGTASWTEVQVDDAGGCALDDQRRLWCWPGAEPLPALLAGDAAWKSLSLGAAHACAIDETDQLFCWGDNQSGQLGLGTTDDFPFPVPVNTESWIAVSAGVTHTCAIHGSGTLSCWGTGALGYIDEQNIARNTPFETLPGTR